MSEILAFISRAAMGERIADVNSRSLGLCSNVGLLVERHMTGVWVMPDRKVRAAVDQ